MSSAAACFARSRNGESSPSRSSRATPLRLSVTLATTARANGAATTPRRANGRAAHSAAASSSASAATMRPARTAADCTQRCMRAFTLSTSSSTTSTSSSPSRRRPRRPRRAAARRCRRRAVGQPLGAEAPAIEARRVVDERPGSRGRVVPAAVGRGGGRGVGRGGAGRGAGGRGRGRRARAPSRRRGARSARWPRARTCRGSAHAAAYGGEAEGRRRCLALRRYVPRSSRTICSGTALNTAPCCRAARVHMVARARTCAGPRATMVRTRAIMSRAMRSAQRAMSTLLRTSTSESSGDAGANRAELRRLSACSAVTSHSSPCARSSATKSAAGSRRKPSSWKRLASGIARTLSRVHTHWPSSAATRGNA